jgi:hypothetical protein
MRPPSPTGPDTPIEAICAATYHTDRVPAFAFLFRVPATGTRCTVYTSDRRRYVLNAPYTLTISDPSHVPVWLPADEVAFLTHCLGLVEDRWREAIAQADAGATQPPADQLPTPGHLTLEPTPAGYATIANRFRDELTRVQHLRARLDQLLPAEPLASDGDPS